MPQAPNFLKLPISSGLSVSMSLNPGIHSEVLAQFGSTFRGSPLLEGAHAEFVLSGAKCGVCAQRGQMSMTDRTWAIGNPRLFCAPSATITSNCQSPVVCLSPCRSIREYTPRFSLDPGIHSEVLALFGNAFRGFRLLEGAHAGFAPSGAKPPL